MKKINKQSVIELLCCAGFGGTMLYLTVSQKYLLFVTPKMQPFLIFTVAASIAWCTLLCTRLFQVQHRQRITQCFVLIIPILLIFLTRGEVAPASAYSGKIAGGNGSLQPAASESSTTRASTPAQAASSVTTSSVADTDSSQQSQPQKSPDGYAAKNMYDQPVEIHGFDAAHKKITVQDKEYFLWVNAVCNDLNKLDDYQITMTGSVYKNPDALQPNQFVPARLLMTCCTADLEPCGLLCEYADTSSLKKDTWVTVTGTITKGMYNGQTEPHIKVLKITPAKPLSGYIYPS